MAKTQSANAKAMSVRPCQPFVSSNSFRSLDSNSSGSTSILQAAICSSVAPWKQSSQTPNPSSDRIGGPNARQVIGRDA